MKEYIKFQGFENETIFIEAASIVAIVESRQRNGCFIHCNGLSAPIGVFMPHPTLVARLTALKLFKQL